MSNTVLLLLLLLLRADKSPLFAYCLSLCVVCCAGGSEAAVKAAGKYRTQGRAYEIQDGDICYYKHG